MTLIPMPLQNETAPPTEHGARRTRVIDLLQESVEPLSVEAVARRIGVHINTARFHLEALVEAGLAARESEVRAQPGRRRVLYTSATVDPPVSPSHGYQLLATILAAEVAANHPETGINLYEVGLEWGRYLTSQPAPRTSIDEADLGERITDKLDSIGFSPEFISEPEPCVVIKNCPFQEWAKHGPNVVCQLYCGILNGSLEVLRSPQRILEMNIDHEEDVCYGRLGSAELVSASRAPVIQTVTASESISTGAFV